MIKRNLRPYEISLWTLQDSYIATLKAIGLHNKGQIETPKCQIKDDGTQELSFNIPMYYYEDGRLVENPIWYNVVNGALIVNLRKLKLIFNKGEEGEEVFEFVINKVVETHANGELYCEVTAEGLAFQELGKVGYKISLKSEDFIDEYNEWYNSTDENKPAEPKNNLNYWCDKIFKNSKWNYEIQMDWSSYDGVVEDLDNTAREAKGLRRTDMIYEEEYIASWETINNEYLTPSKMEGFKEKLRLVDLEKSNIYNLTQNLAETFGVFCKYKYDYDDDYHIIGKKCIFYNNFISEKEGKIDITYPYDASKIEREIDSADIVTKMFVTSIEDGTSPSGLITIADVAANKTKEDYILNFDYLYSIGTISQEQYDAIADYERSMFLKNVEIEPLGMQIANLQNDLVTYEAQLTLSKESQILDKEQLEQSSTLLNSITNSTNRLYKNLDNPHRGVLLRSTEEEENYEIKLTVEGIVDDELINGEKVGYPKNNGDLENIYGIKLWYKTKAPNSDSYTYIEDTNFKINRDPNGNIVSLSGIKLAENITSKIYYVTFAYLPQLHYQRIYDTYAKKLATDEAAEKEATAKIQEIEDKIEKLENYYNNLLKEKELLIADFENMMGPALKEGSWQAENYDDYGSKYTGKVGGENSTQHINFIWDEESFDEEQLLYYEEGTELEIKYYYCIDLSKHLEAIKNNLDNLSFIYNLKEPNRMEQMTIGSELQFAFIKQNGSVKPVLLLTDISFNLKREDLESYFIGVISSFLVDDTAKVEPTTLIKQEDISWITLSSTDIMVYPRLKVNTLLLKTSEDELIIKYNEETLRNYYDYSVLIRDDNYFITIKNKVILKDAVINKVFDIAYSISNVALSLYLDALEVSKTNAMPQVSYTAEISALNEKFIKFAYRNLNRIIGINDAELKFEDVQGYISELELDLDKYWEDKVTIKNYKTKFEDLFSTIVASSEQMKTNSFAYNNAASAFGPGGILKQSIIQSTINQSDLTYAFQSGNLTIDEVNGIWARSDAGVVAMRGGGIFCATQTDSNGNWLWNTGIMPSGINASLITAGQIDTNLIKIYAGDNLRLQLNADGLFAYNVDSLGEADLNQYVVHNSDGLFLIQPKIDDKGNKLEELIKKVEISWDGLIIRNQISGDPVFQTDSNGNLTISGTIKANAGYIGEEGCGWEIVSQGLLRTDGQAGIITGYKKDEEGNLVNAEDSDPMIWVNGSTDSLGRLNEFRVTRGGTLYCTDAIVRGVILADSFIGNTMGEEINQQMRTISIKILDGTTFSFNNRNYDNNLIISPRELKFRIYTNALTTEELTTSEESNPLEGYNFYYCKTNSSEEDDWTLIKKNNDGIYEDLIWEPNYLTFTLKSDIMFKGLEENENGPQTILYFKVKKQGRERKVNEETGEVSCNEPYIYSDTIQLVSEKIGVGKFMTPMSPPSYTFIEDQNNEIQYKDETTFSVELTGFDLEKDKEELENSYWSINGVDCGLRVQLVAANTQDGAADEPGAAVLISDNEEIIIGEEKVEEPYIDDEGKIIYTNIDGRSENITPGIDIFLTVVGDKIVASATISNTIIPEGGNIVLSYHISQASRSANCFKIRNGSDGINIIMRSSSGSTLTSGDIDTELSVEIYYGMQQMNTENSETQFYYVWKKDDVALSNISYKKIETDDSGEEIVTTEKLENIAANNNGQVNVNFFIQDKIYITAANFGIKANYTCVVFTSLEEAVEEYNILNEEGLQSEGEQIDLIME